MCPSHLNWKERMELVGVAQHIERFIRNISLDEPCWGWFSCVASNPLITAN